MKAKSKATKRAPRTPNKSAATPHNTSMTGSMTYLPNLEMGIIKYWLALGCLTEGGHYEIGYWKGWRCIFKITETMIEMNFFLFI